MLLSDRTPTRRTVSLTPLIDVVFLLLVFFMLASTFMKFTSIPVTTVGGGPAATQPAARDIALIHVSATAMTVNATPVASADLENHLARLQATGLAHAVIALRPGATVADLTRTLATVRRVPFTSIRVAD